MNRDLHRPREKATRYVLILQERQQRYPVSNIILTIRIVVENRED